jgi:hypothetical protein
VYVAVLIRVENVLECQGVGNALRVENVLPITLQLVHDGVLKRL